MSNFELNIFIDCRHDTVYDHLSEPLNMIGLLPRLTEIDVLKERKDEQGIVLRPFYLVETYRWLGLSFYRNTVYAVMRLAKPTEELEFHVHGKPGVEIVFNYRFTQFNDGRTQIVQTSQFVKGNKSLANLVINQVSTHSAPCSQI